MTCNFVFLAVGNADSIIISPENNASVVVDVPKPHAVTSWLRAAGNLNIACIFITHAHRDHFAPLIEFTVFLEQWFGIGGSVKNLFISEEVIKDACDTLKGLKNTNNRKYNELHRALERIESWRVNEINLQHPLRSPNPSYTGGDLSIRILHPDLYFSARQRSTAKGKYNEISVVLRVCYGNFTSLLLADLEGAGLADCLNRCKNEELEAQLVKIPHHGAWPSNGSDLDALLQKINPEIAVLSVGSQNKHGHVKPELFGSLLKLKTDQRLKQFICTEVTRTCLYSSVERKSMGRAGLADRRLCAGNIIVVASKSGTWTVQTATDHPSQLNRIKHAACLDHADI